MSSRILVLAALGAIAAAQIGFPSSARASNAFPVESAPPSAAALAGDRLPDPVFLDEAATQPTGVQPYGLVPAPQPVKPTPPLPFHTIEGYGGGAITPMAYLVNPGPANTIFGLPSAAISYVNLDRKDLVSLSLTETVLDRVELGFAAERLDLGNLPDAIRLATNVDINEQSIWLYNFNARFNVLTENSFNSPFVPAVTVGVHVKRNDGISQINDRLGGALSGIGYRRPIGEDFTLTATKTIPNVLFGRPVILTAGLRVSEAAQLGFLGFGNNWAGTFEGSVVYIPTDWLLLAYEYRGKHNPYQQIPGLVGEEDDWHAVDASLIFGSHSTFVVGYGYFGTLANAKANDSVYVQLKYEW